MARQYQQLCVSLVGVLCSGDSTAGNKINDAKRLTDTIGNNDDTTQGYIRPRTVHIMVLRPCRDTLCEQDVNVLSVVLCSTAL